MIAAAMNWRRQAPLVGCLAALAWVAASAASRPQRDAPAFVGVVREGGLLIPIAVHDGREWWNAWPFSIDGDETVDRLRVPRTIDAIPSDWLPPGVKLPRIWRAQVARGRERALRLAEPARVPQDFLLCRRSRTRTRHPAGSRESTAPPRTADVCA